MGGEDDTRLWIDVKTHCFKLGDEELSHKLQSLTLQMRGAFRFFLSRHSLERRGYSKCIQVLADQRIPIYPAARAAEKAFGESAEEYLSKENGW